MQNSGQIRPIDLMAIGVMAYRRNVYRRVDSVSNNLISSSEQAEAYYYVTINAPMACLTLNRLHKSLMVGRETSIQTNQTRPKS